jgi:pimeloyl-ACP methyl ester carboxylesterase
VIRAAAQTLATSAPDGVPIVYERWGEAAPALVYIHGWCCNRSYWRHQPEVLARGWRRLFLDLGGHGESGMRVQASLAAFAADVTAVLEAESVGQAILVGHSMGGVVALAAAQAARARVVGIVGIDTFKQPAQRLSDEQIDSMLAGLQADFPGAIAALVKTRMFTPGLDTGLAEAVAASMAAQAPDMAVAAQRALLAAPYGDLLRETAARLPLGLINADYVPTDTAALKERCPRMEITIIPGNSHFPMLERPASFNPLLEAHIRRIAAAAGLR